MRAIQSLRKKVRITKGISKFRVKRVPLLVRPNMIAMAAIGGLATSNLHTGKMLVWEKLSSICVPTPVLWKRLGRPDEEYLETPHLSYLFFL